MKVAIKTFDVAMEVKKSGVELEIKSPDGATHLGDCFITMKGLVWCQGRKNKKNGVDITWQELIEICGSPASLKAALAAAKSMNKPKKVQPSKPKTQTNKALKQKQNVIRRTRK